MLGTLGQEAESGTGWEGPRHPRRVGWGNRGAEPPERNTTPVGWGGALGRGGEEEEGVAAKGVACRGGGRAVTNRGGGAALADRLAGFRRLRGRRAGGLLLCREAKARAAAGEKRRSATTAKTPAGAERRPRLPRLSPPQQRRENEQEPAGMLRPNPAPQTHGAGDVGLVWARQRGGSAGSAKQPGDTAGAGEWAVLTHPFPYLAGDVRGHGGRRFGVSSILGDEAGVVGGDAGEAGGGGRGLCQAAVAIGGTG